MFSAFRATSCSILLFAITFSLTTAFVQTAFGQTTIDDVHITPHARTAEVAAGEFAANPAVRVAAGSLIRTSVDLVMVPVTITDNLNRPVIGLDQNNFQVFENRKPQEIKHFSTEDAPVSVGIIVDTSGSMAEKIDRAREAVTQFCEAANPQDEFFLITFADTPRLATDFTTHTENIENDLLTARAKGRTALLDAIYMGLQKMRQARYARKALLILSDGGDNHSRYTEHDVRAAVKESDVMIYGVGTYDNYFTTQEERLGPELLSSISDLTGGYTFTLTHVNDLPVVTRTIGAQLRHQYLLAYQPPAHLSDGKWHKVSVKLRLPKKLQYFLRVEAKAGYYAREE
jgi:Ca-activated chloride channel family protein